MSERRVLGYRAVQSKSNDHEEEDEGEEGCCWHGGHGLRVGDEEQAGTLQETEKGESFRD